MSKHNVSKRGGISDETREAVAQLIERAERFWVEAERHEREAVELRNRGEADILTAMNLIMQEDGE